MRSRTSMGSNRSIIAVEVPPEGCFSRIVIERGAAMVVETPPVGWYDLGQASGIRRFGALRVWDRKPLVVQPVSR